MSTDCELGVVAAGRLAKGSDGHIVRTERIPGEGGASGELCMS